jgi:hypothetical protein
MKPVNEDDIEFQMTSPEKFITVKGDLGFTGRIDTEF